MSHAITLSEGLKLLARSGTPMCLCSLRLKLEAARMPPILVFTGELLAFMGAV